MQNTLANKTIMETSKGKVTLTWINDADIDKYKPYYQVYGLCFNEKGEILLINEKGKWKIPGGTPEIGETAETTLKRELIEEADITIKKCLPLGVQKVEFPNNPNVNEGDLYYQYRYICLINELLERSPDPDNGLIHPRIFVSRDKIQDYVNWGNSGNTMFNDAFNSFDKLVK